jgi:hypothetical protein
MKRNYGLWKIFGSIILWTVFSVSMIGAQPSPVRTPRHPIHTPYGFTHWQELPCRDFTGQHGLRSNAFNTAEISQKLQFTQPHGLFDMRHPLKGFFTPEQFKKLFAYRLIYRLHLASQKLLLTPNTLELKTFQQEQTAIAVKSVTVSKEQFENFAQARTLLTPKQYLQALQILRV